MYIVKYALDGQQQSSVTRGAILGAGWGHLKDRAAYWGQQRLRAANLKKGIPVHKLVKPKLRWRGALKTGLLGAGLGMILGYSQVQRNYGFFSSLNQPSPLRLWGGGLIRGFREGGGFTPLLSARMGRPAIWGNGRSLKALAAGGEKLGLRAGRRWKDLPPEKRALILAGLGGSVGAGPGFLLGKTSRD